MGILDRLLARVLEVNDALTGGELVRDVVAGHPDDILDLQRRQLFEGRASSGEDLRPYYSEDVQPSGYFRDSEAAARYAAWKRDGVDYPYEANRNPDAPNLYINGKFHSELEVFFGPDRVQVVGATPTARIIIAKYGSESFGLTAGNWNEVFRERGALDELLTNMKRILYGN